MKSSLFEQALMRDWSPHHYQADGAIIERNWLYCAVTYRLCKVSAADGEIPFERVMQEIGQINRGELRSRRERQPA